MILLNYLLKKYLIGYLVRLQYNCLYILKADLHSILSILFFNTLLKCNALLDCMASDYPTRRFRFEVLYSF
jgi:hypothetical protein